MSTVLQIKPEKVIINFRDISDWVDYVLIELGRK